MRAARLGSACRPYAAPGGSITGPPGPMACNPCSEKPASGEARTGQRCGAALGRPQGGAELASRSRQRHRAGSHPSAPLRAASHLPSCPSPPPCRARTQAARRGPGHRAPADVPAWAARSSGLRARHSQALEVTGRPTKRPQTRGRGSPHHAASATTGRRHAAVGLPGCSMWPAMARAWPAGIPGGKAPGGTDGGQRLRFELPRIRRLCWMACNGRTSTESAAPWRVCSSR
jgi:hypothetical protein